MILPLSRQFVRAAAGLILMIPLAGAQQWEIGGAVGYANVRAVNINRDSASAKASLEAAPVVSVYASHRERRWFGGDFWYTFRPGDLKLTSGGSNVTFGSQSHLVHYDIRIHPLHKREARIDPYFAVGGGLRVIRGTGRETAFQGLNQLAVLSRTQEVLPLLSVAAGVRAQVAPHVSLRFEIRDNVTAFPGKVISVNRSATSGGWWHDLTPQVGLGVTF